MAKTNCIGQMYPCKKPIRSWFPNQKRWLKIWLILQDGCFCMIGDCCKVLSLKEATIDHIKPLGHGGTDDWDNLQLACHDCNQVKGDMYEGRRTYNKRGTPRKAPSGNKSTKRSRNKRALRARLRAFEAQAWLPDARH